MACAPTDDLATTGRAFGDLVAAVRHDQWSAPTPCAQWDVRALVNHVVTGDDLFARILRGRTSNVSGGLDPKTEDTLGDDPSATHRRAADDLLAAFRQPDVLSQVFQVPVGTVPGIAAAHLRTVENLVHGWDLARATGQQTRFPDNTVERELEFTRGKLVDVPSDRSPFAPPQPVPDDAPPLDRLAALLGRPVHPHT